MFLGAKGTPGSNAFKKTLPHELPNNLRPRFLEILSQDPVKPFTLQISHLKYQQSKHLGPRISEQVLCRIPATNQILVNKCNFPN